MPSSTCSRIFLLMVWMVFAVVASGTGDPLGGLPGGFVDQVSLVLSQVVEEHLGGCHLVLAATTDNTSVFSSLITRLMAGGRASVVVEVGSLFSEEESAQGHLLHGVWGDATATCHALILQMDNTDNDLTFRFLEASRLWLRPETPTLVIGRMSEMNATVHHAGLRNTIHMLYLALDNLALLSQPNTSFRKETLKKGIGHVKAFRRCLYCNKGEMGVHLLQQSNLSSPVQWDDNVFLEELQNFMGHTFKVVTLQYFPFFAYKEENLVPGEPLSPVDSLDLRIITTMATHLNFTYEIREPWDGTWGVLLAGGNWSGIVGTLQHEQADFSVNLTPSSSRMKVITHSFIYTYDPMLIVSLRPGTLPRHLALLRPFKDELWLIVIVCTSVAGVNLWLLQKVWSWASGGRSLSLDSALLYSWGLLLQDPPTDPPLNISGQVFVGWWLLSCLVIVTAYHSSLIAHLSVQSKFPPINSFEDLLSRDGWSWGGPVIWGTTFLYYNQSTNPVILEVYKNMKIMTACHSLISIFHIVPRAHVANQSTYENVMKGFERILQGGFSFINHKHYTKIEMESRYYNRFGYTPLHISTTEYPILGGNSWGFRQGAPFLPQIRNFKMRLTEAGLIDLWLDEVIKTRAKDLKAERGVLVDAMDIEVDAGQVVLGLDHLQGVFYLLLLGYMSSLCTFLGEAVLRDCIPSQTSQIMDEVAHLPGAFQRSGLTS